jgi:hypothetical protein
MRMGRDSTFLLDEGDELRLSDSVTLIYRSLVTARGVVLSAVQRREKEVRENPESCDRGVTLSSCSLLNMSLRVAC